MRGPTRMVTVNLGVLEDLRVDARRGRADGFTECLIVMTEIAPGLRYLPPTEEDVQRVLADHGRALSEFGRYKLEKVVRHIAGVPERKRGPLDMQKNKPLGRIEKHD